jgi:elongation factor Ts
MAELLCETDFVARNEIFQKLAHDIVLQVASMGAKNAKELEGQVFIKDPGKKIKDLVQEAIAKTGENIRIGRISRLELGK